MFESSSRRHNERKGTDDSLKNCPLLPLCGRLDFVCLSLFCMIGRFRGLVVRTQENFPSSHKIEEGSLVCDIYRRDFKTEGISSEHLIDPRIPTPDLVEF